MRFPAKEALEVFEKAGARIINKDTVLIDETLVNKALKTTLKRKDVTLFAKDPKNDVRFEMSFAKINTWQICRNTSCSVQ